MRGPGCSGDNELPSPAPFVIDWATVSTDMNSGKVQGDFAAVSDGDALTCVVAPSGGDLWPFGGKPSTTSLTPNDDGGVVVSSDKARPGGNPGGAIAGTIVCLILVATLLFFVRKWWMRKREEERLYLASKEMAQRPDFATYQQS